MVHPVLPPEPPPILEPVQPANPIPRASNTQLDSVTEAKTGVRRSGKTGKFQSLSISLKTPSSESVTAKTLSTPNNPESFPPEFSQTANGAELSGQKQADSKLSQAKEDVQQDRRGETIAQRLRNSRTLRQKMSPHSHLPVSSRQSPRLRANRAGVSNSDNGSSVNVPVTASAEVIKQESDVKGDDRRQQVSNEIAQTITKSQELSQAKARLLTEKLAQRQKQSHAVAQNFGDFNPLQIEFKSRTQKTQLRVPASAAPATINQQQNQPPKTNPPGTPPGRERVVEVTSDRQVYDEQRRIITAEGNVVVRFEGAVVDADRLQVSLDNLIAVGEGNVVLTRGDQVLRGQRFTYNFVQDNGQLQNGRGDIYVPTTQTDFAFLPTDVTTGGVPPRPPSDRIRATQPLSGVSSPGGVDITVGGTRNTRNLPPPKQGGVVNRLRFQAENIDFYPRGWQARGVRITNDPFSPPELELRANKVTLTRESPLRDRIKTDGQRLVFDQSFSLPIPREQQVIDRSERQVNPGLFSFGFDGGERGGLFLERSFQPVNTEQTRWTVTPQFYAQEAVQSGTSNVSGLFGLKTKLDAVLSPRTVVEGSGALTSLDLSKVEDNLKASLRLRQIVGDRLPHTVALEYSYRDRLFNGTLGFQRVQSSIGGLISSPVIPLGKSGINLSYQTGAQYINANTDRQDLLEPRRENDRISLGRIQSSAALNGGLLLWQGKPLPATAKEGLRYAANPVVPYLRAFGGITGTNSYYTNGDNQATLIGTVGLEGQVGHFSRPFLDYTAFNISYSQGLNTGLSPFLFDRFVDNKILSAGITQQIYGPFRLGFQTSINLDTGESSSTDYILEYSRRTYGISVRYNPVLELGAITFRLSDFNWTGGTDPFSDTSEVKPVVGGVRQE